MKLLSFLLAFLFCIGVNAAVVTGYQGNYQAVSTTIAASGTTSAAVTLDGFTPVGIFLPATFTGTSLTFEAATSAAGTYVAVKDKDGSSVSYTVAQGTYVALNPQYFYGIRYLKIKSGSTEGSTRTLTLAVKGF